MQKGGSCQASARCRWSWWRGAETAWCQLRPQGRPLRSRQVGATLIVFRRCVRLWCSRDNVIDVFFGVLTGEECQLTCQFHGWGRLHAMQRPIIFLLRIKYREAFRWLYVSTFGQNLSPLQDLLISLFTVSVWCSPGLTTWRRPFHHHAFSTTGRCIPCFFRTLASSVGPVDHNQMQGQANQDWPYLGAL